MQEDYTPPGVKLRFACSMRKEKVIQKIYYRKWWFTMKERKKHLEQTQVNYMCNLKIMTSTKGISIFQIPNLHFWWGFKKVEFSQGKKTHLRGRIPGIEIDVLLVAELHL